MGIGTDGDNYAMNPADDTRRYRSSDPLKLPKSKSPTQKMSGSCSFLRQIRRAGVLALSVCANVVLAHGATQHVPRRLEDAQWSGEWDGQWEAAENDDVVYDCDGDNCNDSGSTRSGW